MFSNRRETVQTMKSSTMKADVDAESVNTAPVDLFRQDGKTPVLSGEGYAGDY